MWYWESDNVTVVSRMFPDHWIALNARILYDPVIWEHPLHLIQSIRSCYCSLMDAPRYWIIFNASIWKDLLHLAISIKSCYCSLINALRSLNHTRCIKFESVIWEHSLHLIQSIQSCYCSLVDVPRSLLHIIFPGCARLLWSCYLVS